MRVLCLHGRGTSAAIFQAQTASFRAKLGDGYTFDFVDGPFPCTPAPGVDAIFESDHFCWWPTESATAVRDAHRWLDQYLAAHGPYDALMGFSQGCMLIGSYLLGWQRDPRHTQPQPVSAAIFICGGLSFAWMGELGLAVSPRAHAIDQRSGASLQKKAGRLRELTANPALIQRGVGLWDDTSDLEHPPGTPLPADDRDIFGLDFTAYPADVFVDIPTVHIYGAKDPRLPGAIQMAHFCRRRTLYDHGGGHDIPRSSAVSLHIAEMVAQLDDLRK